MWWSFVANIPPTLITLVTYCFCLGNAEDALNSPAGLPIIAVFSNMSSFPAGATGLTFVLLILLTIIATSTMASTSRQTFAFARDNGLPLSRFIGAVNQHYKVPANSIVVSIIFTTVMALINIGSTAAFNAFLSVSVVALMATYSISIFCMLLKRIRHEPLVSARWRLFGRNTNQDERGSGLGRYGLFVNSLALVYSVWSFFWGFWPSIKDVTPATLNWAFLIFTAIMALAALAYVVHARKVYDGPVAKVVTGEELS